MTRLILLLLFVRLFVKAKECPSRAFIEQTLLDVHVPGAAIVVVNTTDILYQEAFGYQSLSPIKMMDIDRSIFVLASISKTFISVAVMQLVEANRLDLDADINEYLSSTKQRIIHPDYPCDPITLRQLLSHSASIGVDEIIGLSILEMGDTTFTSLTLADVCIDYLTRNSSNWLQHPPGTVTLYSNIGTALAAGIVELVTKTPYTEYVREKILKPLGIDLTKAGFRLSDIENREDLVKQYAFNSSYLPLWQQEIPQINITLSHSPDWLSIPFFSMNIYPAGLLRMSATSLSIFLRMFMNNGFPLLTPQSIKEMRQVVEGVVPYPNASASVDDWRLKSLGYGVIWSWRQASNGRRFIGHGGTIPGASHAMLINEQNTIGVIVLTMADVYSNDALTKKFGDAFANIRMSFFECFEN